MHTNTRVHNTRARAHIPIALKVRNSSDPVYLHTTPSTLVVVYYMDVRHGAGIKYDLSRYYTSMYYIRR